MVFLVHNNLRIFEEINCLVLPFIHIFIFLEESEGGGGGGGWVALSNMHYMFGKVNLL